MHDFIKQLIIAINRTWHAITHYPVAVRNMVQQLKGFFIKPASPYIVMALFMGCCLLLSPSCRETNKPANGKVYFKTLKAKQTGLNFSNILKATDSLDVFNYMYFYNGAGAAAGDFNNDGLIDVFFCLQPGR